MRKPVVKIIKKIYELAVHIPSIFLFRKYPLYFTTKLNLPQGGENLLSTTHKENNYDFTVTPTHEK
ncbi:hypothetical protein CON72_16630, partial [Bacillus wiedmannii]